jgi:hypothetical protein
MGKHVRGDFKDTMVEHLKNIDVKLQPLQAWSCLVCYRTSCVTSSKHGKRWKKMRTLETWEPRKPSKVN